MENIWWDAITRRSRRKQLLAGFAMALLIGTQPTLAQAPKDASVTRQDLTEAKSTLAKGEPMDAGALEKPLMRILATTSSAMLADSKYFDAALEVAEVAQLVSLEGITPASPILDHCDRIVALKEHADAIGKRYPDYIAIARKQGEAEVAANRLQPGEVDAYLEGMTEQRPGFEQRWATAGKLTQEAGALCTVLARRHWRIDSAGLLDIDDPDRAEVEHLLESLQEVGQLAIALDEAAAANLDQQMRKLPASR